MIDKVDHIGIVVDDLEEALKLYSKGLHLVASHVEEMVDLNLRLAFIPVGDVMIELIEPTGPGIYQKFLQTKGQGLHHICYRVDDILYALKESGKHFKLIDSKPRPGGDGSQIAFLDPQSIFNTETEFVQRKKLQLL